MTSFVKTGRSYLSLNVFHMIFEESYPVHYGFTMPGSCITFHLFGDPVNPVGFHFHNDPQISSQSAVQYSLENAPSLFTISFDRASSSV